MLRVPQEVRVRPGAQKSRSTALPAPIGGLNARDSIANMPPQDAVALENWFPEATSVRVRKGYTAWSTFTGVCQSILVYAGNTATKIFPCVKNGSTYSIFEGTSSGALSSPVVGGSGPTVQALTSCRFDYVSFGTSGGQFMSVVNGVDVPLEYDGTTWSASATSGGTPANYFTVQVYARRLWYGVKDTLRVRYLAADTKSGATTLLELGPLFKLGGYLNSIITVTDNTDSLADYIGFLSSEGEIVAFTGPDPSTPADWRLAAHFVIGRPVIKGNRCWVKWGSDALVLCADGVYPLRAAIQANAREQAYAVSDKIRTLLNSDVAIHGDRYGWQMAVHPTGSKLIVNVPTNEDVAAQQYVMNTETKAWCKYTGWNAFSFGVARDTLYMGMNGKMVKADVGYIDGSSAIFTDARQAYNYMGARGRVKDVKMIQPVLAADGSFDLGASVDVNFTEQQLNYLRPITGGGGDPWGGVWDVTWGGATTVFRRWLGVAGIGESLSLRLKTRSDAAGITWSATTVLYETGGVLG